MSNYFVQKDHAKINSFCNCMVNTCTFAIGQVCNENWYLRANMMLYTYICTCICTYIYVPHFIGFLFKTIQQQAFTIHLSLKSIFINMLQNYEHKYTRPSLLKEAIFCCIKMHIHYLVMLCRKPLKFGRQTCRHKKHMLTYTSSVEFLIHFMCFLLTVKTILFKIKTNNKNKIKYIYSHIILSG